MVKILPYFIGCVVSWYKIFFKNGFLVCLLLLDETCFFKMFFT